MRVMSIGSCRIRHPLNSLAATGRVEIQPTSQWGHVHQPPEQLQLLRWLRGELDLPAEVAPVVTGPNFNGRPASLDNVELLVVEISSSKVFSLDSWVLHHIQCYHWLVNEGLGDFARLLRSGSLPEDRLPFLRPGLGDLQQRLVLGARRDTLTRSDIETGMHAIRSLFDGPILFATHWETRHRNGEFVRERSALIETVSRAASEMGAPCFNPSRLIHDHGDSALNGAFHYQDAFIPTVAEALMAELGALQPQPR